MYTAGGDLPDSDSDMPAAPRRTTAEAATPTTVLMLQILDLVVANRG